MSDMLHLHLSQLITGRSFKKKEVMGKKLEVRSNNIAYSIAIPSRTKSNYWTNLSLLAPMHGS